MLKRDFFGNTIKSANVVKFQCEKETFVEKQLIIKCCEIPIVEKRLFVETQLIIECCKIPSWWNETNIQQRCIFRNHC